MSTEQFFLATMSPAKRFHDCRTLPAINFSTPCFLQQADALALKLKCLSQADIERIMAVSVDIAALNHQRYNDYLPDNSGKTFPCGYLFAGDAFKSLNFPKFSPEKQKQAQEHLFILSGLYGLLRPLDRISHYRLEMGCRIKPYLGYHLHDFWKKPNTDFLNAHIAKHGICYHINLASSEYAKSIDQPALSVPTIHCVFATANANGYKVTGIKAKKARGAMARFLLSSQPRSLDEIKSFSDGYRFSHGHSTASNFVFLEN